MQIFTVPNCRWCVRAKEIAESLGMEIEEFDFYSMSPNEWLDLIGIVPQTAPQIFVDGEYIGGCSDFIEWKYASNCEE